jgi:uncharacterized protein YmfQ (DUF2313 family)
MTDITAQILKLLPNGEAWAKSVTSNMYKTVQLFTGSIARLYAFADYCLRDTFPTTAVASFSNWQASLNLPDPTCPMLTGNQYQLQMLMRVENLGGMSPQRYIDFAAAIGYPITITELCVPRAGLAKVGSTSNGLGADHVWCVHVANATLLPFRVGNRINNPYQLPLVRLSSASSIAWLQYEFARIKPSHTQIEYFAS